MAADGDGYTDGSALLFPLPDEFGDAAGIIALHSKIAPPFLDQDREICTILASYSCEVLRAVRATEEIRENASRFRNILDTIPTGIIIVDAETHKLVSVNPAAATMVGTDPGSMVGKVCHEVLCPAEEGNCPMTSIKERRTSLSASCSQRIGSEKRVPVLKTVSRTMLEGPGMLY